MRSKAPPTIVDRTIHQQIPPLISRNTPSSVSGVSSETEFLHRIHGTSILYQVTKLLRLSPSVYATSTTIFHRFYYRCSLTKYDVWSVSIASVLLACKTEEEIRKIREIILVFVHVYRRMRLGVGSDEDIIIDNHDNNPSDNDNSVTLKHITVARCSILKDKKLTLEEKKNSLRYIRPLSQNGMQYREWEDAVMEMENVILRELGFTLHWITDSHPHVFLLYFLKVLNVNVNGDDAKRKRIGQNAWNYCNDSCRLDICVRYSPELTACAAIHLALIEEGMIIQPKPKPWWHAFIGEKCDEDLSTVCNAILALGDRDCVEGYVAASKEYVVSLLDDGSFCDPGSYIWNDIPY